MTRTRAVEKPACLVYWQASETSRFTAAPDFPFDPDLLRHVSPIEWDNVILYGEIKIDPAKLTRRNPWRVFLHESGQYPIYGYDKKMNVDLAKLATLDDLAGTDLREFLELAVVLAGG